MQTGTACMREEGLVASALWGPGVPTQCSKAGGPSLPGSAMVPVEGRPWSVLQGRCMFMARREGGQPRLRGEPTTPMESLGGFPRRSRKSSLCLNLICTISKTPGAATTGSCLTGPSPSCPQIEILSPYEAVAERFKEQYKMFATALDTTRHELPVKSIHLDGDGQRFLGRKWGVCQARSRRNRQCRKFLYARHLNPCLSPS